MKKPEKNSLENLGLGEHWGLADLDAGLMA
jgi:hypothetical protein